MNNLRRAPLLVTDTEKQASRLVSSRHQLVKSYISEDGLYQTRSNNLEQVCLHQPSYKTKETRSATSCRGNSDTPVWWGICPKGPLLIDCYTEKWV